MAVAGPVTRTVQVYMGVHPCIGTERAKAPLRMCYNLLQTQVKIVSITKVKFAAPVPVGEFEVEGERYCLGSGVVTHNCSAW